jgi:hypothetical protein
MRKPMKTEEQKKESAKDNLRSVDEFTKRFYPKPINPETPEFPDAEDVGEKLAKESLDRLQAALAVK